VKASSKKTLELLKGDPMEPSRGKRTQSAEHAMPERAIKVLAQSIYKQLKTEGCQNQDIIGISSQLITLVRNSLLNGTKS
jgi:cytochrome c-type biogenesis protein CcmH/NrfF